MSGSRNLHVETTRGRIEVRAGEVVAVAGAGAEEAVQTAIGTRPTGHVSLGDRRLRWGPAGHVRAGIGVVQDVPVAPRQSVRDHLLPRVGHDRAAALLADAPLLAGRGDDPAGVLSGGERTVLAWLRCLATDPAAVMLVRPTAGLDERTLDWASRVVATWASDQVPVLLLSDRPESAAWAHRTVELG